MFDTLRDAVTAPIATLAETIQTAIVNLQADKQDESLAEEHDATTDVKVNALLVSLSMEIICDLGNREGRIRGISR